MGLVATLAVVFGLVWAVQASQTRNPPAPKAPEDPRRYSGFSNVF
jgi:hypothetical protein